MTTATITLAKLYESQNHLLDALIIYNKLRKKSNDPEIEKKINELSSRYFKGNKFKYNTVIDEIFTEEDKIKFQIFPQDQFNKISAHIKETDNDDIEEEMDNPVDSQLKRFTDIVGNLKQDELEETLVSVFGSQKNLEDIKLSKVWQALVENGYER